MSEDATYEMITIAVESYEDENQATEVPKANTRGLVSQLLPNKNAVKQDTTQVNVRDLEQKMSGFLGMVGRVFSSAEKEAKKTAGMCLDEIELSVEIGAEGEIRLIGSGAKANGKSAIKLKFKRVAESK
jgi:hypothetical protein